MEPWAWTQDGEAKRVIWTIWFARSSWFFCHSHFARGIWHVLLGEIASKSRESKRGRWALHQSHSQGLLSKAYSLYLRLVLGLCSYRFGLWVPRMHLYMWHWQSDWQLSGGLYNTGTTFWNTVSLSVYKDSYFCDHEYEMSFLKRTCISACM